ncbi:MAG: tripartite tricarboxylate transporter permease [Halobacteriales archaeon]
MVAGLRFALAPEATATALLFVAVGVVLGIASGLVPGLHVNAFALLLAAAAQAVPGPPRFVAAAMLAAGTVHTFLDVVPTLALGVPDPAMAASALPGHRLVIEGRGREALRLSALGSGLAVAFAVPLAVPVTAAMTRLYPVLSDALPLVLLAIVGLLLLTEPSLPAAAAGAVAFLASSALGAVVLDQPAAGVVPAGSMLAPLFAGLFGAPVLLDAIGGEGVPEQEGPQIATPRSVVGATALVGTVSGAVVGFLPGVSAAIAAALALHLVPADTGARGFVVATSGVNTANAVFALFALATLGTPRTGVMVAVERSNAPVVLPLLLASVGVASAVGFVLVTAVGDPYLRTVGRMDYARVSVAVLALLAVLSFLFAGPLGVAAFVAAGLVGLLPTRLGTRRVHLMGVLIGPLILGL